MLGASNFSPGDGRADDREDARADHSPDAERGKRPRPEGLFERVLGFFRVPDQLIDRFAGKQLAGQCSSPHPAAVAGSGQCALRSGPGLSRGRNPCRRVLRAVALPLRHTARHFLDFLLVFAARSGAFGLGGGLLAGRAFQLLAFQLVFNFGGICHLVTSFTPISSGFPANRVDMNSMLTGIERRRKRQTRSARAAFEAALQRFPAYNEERR